MKEISIGNRRIGDSHRCYIIAEIGSNHDRRLDQAMQLIDLAAKAGVDAVKFQTFSGKTLYSSKSPRFSYLGALGNKSPDELLEEISLPREWQETLAAHCAERGVEFLSTPFDLRAVDELAALGVKAYKISSFEIVDLGLIRYIAKRGQPVLISTGMASLGEIEDAIFAAVDEGAAQLCVLQCASLYPAPPEAMNLRAIPMMKAAFGIPVGLSDHSSGIHIAPAAVAVGANLLEKHFTLDRSLSGPDHSFSIEPDELASLVQHVRDVEAAMGDGQKHGPSPEEQIEMYAKARRSIVAASDVPAGTFISAEMLTVKRPGTGIHPRFMEALVGRVSKIDIEEDDPISWDMV